MQPPRPATILMIIADECRIPHRLNAAPLWLSRCLRRRAPSPQCDTDKAESEQHAHPRRRLGHSWNERANRVEYERAVGERPSSFKLGGRKVEAVQASGSGGDRIIGVIDLKTAARTRQCHGVDGKVAEEEGSSRFEVLLGPFPCPEEAGLLRDSEIQSTAC